MNLRLKKKKEKLKKEKQRIAMSSPSTRLQSNLERFLQCVTPVVPSRFLPQSCIHDLTSSWQPPGSKDMVEYFTLGDLWDCYDEWSAYGSGTQVLLNKGESVMQYYVPYLSAIQIYSNKAALAFRNLNPGEHIDAVEFESDSWSDDSTNDKLSRSLSNNSSQTWETSSEDLSVDHEGSLLTMERFGYLYLQYFETSSPCWRIPLIEKITELARNHPGLMTLKNVDLSPASWMAVAWYPIYHIPTKRNEKDLSTSFLTYHTLSSSFQDCGNEHADMLDSIEATRIKPKDDSSGGISLPPFGMANYKLQGDLWVKPETSDLERIIYLRSAADSWLKQLDVYHHDYNFFTSHSTV
ncbi:uncharacterized protein LOC110609332 [Manihot esculenta]|uniref:DUF789 domain-containing protein n=1 Tax=Manihot esculenta TaxID=3983 RepID=A0A2C9WFE4_MANES|nr:uncharacterized protein LOC110609332 [Manihot esculenta]XP_021604532.1 uncharacterized protein LOC110609332 [Manihot esculenta]OAY57715.1 hypothetical protein MANES_02G118100v8 [Manihot esculenta]